MRQPISWILLLSFSCQQFVWGNPDFSRLNQKLAPPLKSHQQILWLKSRPARVIQGSLVVFLLLAIANQISQIGLGSGLLELITDLKREKEPWSAIGVDGFFGGLITVIQDQVRWYLVHGKEKQSEPRHPKVDLWRIPAFFFWGLGIGMFTSWFYTFQNNWIPAEATLWTPTLRVLINRMVGANFGLLQSLFLVRTFALWSSKENGDRENHRVTQHQYSHSKQVFKFLEGFLISAPIVFFNGYFIHNFLGSQEIVARYGDFRILYGWTSGIYIGMIHSWIVNRREGTRHPIWRKVNFAIIGVALSYIFIVGELFLWPVHLSWGLLPLACLVYLLVLMTPEQASPNLPEQLPSQAVPSVVPHIFSPSKVPLEMAL